MSFVLEPEPEPVQIQKKESGSALERLRNEFDGYMEEMNLLQEMEPSEVYMKLSGWTARATEIRIQLARSNSARTERMKSKEIEPFIEEAERQFRFFSRYQAAQAAEAELSGRTT